MRRFLDKIMLLDLFAGLGITFRHIWKRKVTVQYPEERMEPAHRFRGMFRLDEERCIKCTLCARDCPIDIVYIDWHQEVNPETEKKEKVSDQAEVDLADDQDLRVGELRSLAEPLRRHGRARRLEDPSRVHGRGGRLIGR